MGALAQVYKLVVSIDGDRRVFGQSFNQLDLVGLIGEHRFGGGPREVLTLEDVAGFDRFIHQLLNLFQVLRSERSGNFKVVVEPVFDGRAYAHLGFGEKFQYSVGHHVGGRVSHGLTVGLGFV